MLIDVAPLLAAQNALDASRKAELAQDLDAAHTAALEAIDALTQWSGLLSAARAMQLRNKRLGIHVRSSI